MHNPMTNQLYQTKNKNNTKVVGRRNNKKRENRRRQPKTSPLDVDYHRRLCISSSFSDKPFLRSCPDFGRPRRSPVGARGGDRRRRHPLPPSSCPCSSCSPSSSSSSSASASSLFPSPTPPHPVAAPPPPTPDSISTPSSVPSTRGRVAEGSSGRKFCRGSLGHSSTTIFWYDKIFIPCLYFNFGMLSTTYEQFFC